ncbi:MAG: OmpA family protein [Bacteroidota bacterium]
MNLKRILLIAAIGIFFLNSAKAQMKFYNRAEETYKAGQYIEAVDQYREAYDKIQGKEIKAEIVFKLAECYRKTGQPRKAELWYNNAIKKEYDNPKIYLHYANALLSNEDFEEAKENYEIYKEKVPDDPRGEKGIESSEKAQKWKENPNGYRVEEVKFINSRNNDYCPTYSKSGYNEIYFTSSREEATGDEKHGGTGEKFADIFYSQQDMSGRWSEPEGASDKINTEVEEGATSFTGDYNTMYFTRCEVDKKKMLGCKIMRTNKDGEEWEKPEALTIAEDSFVVAHPSISDDGSTLYFAANLPGGQGGTDIWKVNKTNEGWSEPINLGDQINTAGKEVFPFIHPDGTLYFSSDSHVGMGGLDIFKATPKSDDSWEIENMRYPVNSTHDDFGIVFQDEKEKGFLTSSRKRGDDKIFSFVLPPLKFSVEGVVKNKKTEDPIENASVKLVGSDGMTMSSETDEDGSFKFMLRPGTDYVFVASKKNFLTNKGKASTKGLEESKVFEPEILLSSIKEPIELPNIFYDFAKADLRDESKEALDNLVETLNDNPRVVIELRSHTDFRGDHWSNVELSTERAESVVNYLIDNGIDPARLRAKGYAATMPKEIDSKLASEYDFLEEGDVLTEEFIKDLEEEEQREDAHQINRRTEFKVIATDFEP